MSLFLSSRAQPTIILAPMAGVTDGVFRDLVQKYSQPSLVISEMIASQAVIRDVEKTMLRQSRPGENAAVQLAGNDPEVMAQAARQSVERGACLIDINMGCPVKKIAVNSYAGSALMKDLPLARQIFKAVVKAVPVPVTVKIRKGWDALHQNAADFIRLAQDEGLEYVTVHGRTRCQLFSGQADWDFLEQLQQQFAPYPIIGNGDITTVEEARQSLTKTSGIMVGRGTYGRPWFLGQVRAYVQTGHCPPPPPLSQQHTIVQEHVDGLLHYYGTERGLLMARKHLGWYSKHLPGSSDFRARVFQATDPCVVREWITSFYTQAQDMQGTIPSAEVL
jgi:tRNA-dihydrouridine synthase B